MSCSKTQRSDADEAGTRDPSELPGYMLPVFLKLNLALNKFKHAK